MHAPLPQPCPLEHVVLPRRAPLPLPHRTFTGETALLVLGIGTTSLSVLPCLLPVSEADSGAEEKVFKRRGFQGRFEGPDTEN